MTAARRGDLRRALDRDLSRLRRNRNLILGRDALVKLARDLADTYDQEGRPETLSELLGVLDRLGVGRVPLLDQADSFTALMTELAGAD
jgi:hypothetical protein